MNTVLHLLGLFARPPGRTFALLAILAVVAAWRYWPFPAGVDVRDGRHDRGTNGIWLQHGWLGDDGWFQRNGKKDRIPEFRSPEAIRGLAQRLAAHHVTDLFPHLCPTSTDGRLPPCDPEQVDRFVREMAGLRVMPWIGGAYPVQAFPSDPAWRATFALSTADLLCAHPGLAGVHLNIEPCRSGNPEYLALLDQIRAALPPGKVLSVAAYPPPTVWQPASGVHWDETYFRAVARRVDQLAVMMYDTGLREPDRYRGLMCDWTRACIDWAGTTHVLLGVPTYDDPGVAYHHAEVENLANSLLGIHQGLGAYRSLPANYAGIALYCEWEMDEGEWAHLRGHFLRGR